MSSLIGWLGGGRGRGAAAAAAAPGRRFRAIVEGQVYVLHEPATPEQARVDIVFFHGLQLMSAQDAFCTTWTSKVPGKVDDQEEDVCWPSEWLGAQDFPEARILSISYNSIAHGAGGERPRDIARALLKNMVDLAEVGQQRPVVLVGHSLGGLIIKLICKQAHEKLIEPNSETYAEFLHNTLGVFFFATPQGGADLAAKASRYLSSVLRFTPALRFLATENPDLRDLSLEFGNLTRRHHWEIYSLAEVQPVKVLGVLVVDTNLFDRLGDYTTISDADHFSICKPQSKGHPSYLWIHQFVTRLLQMDEECGNIDRPYRAARALPAGGEKTSKAIEYIKSRADDNEGKSQLMRGGVMTALLALLEHPTASFDTKTDACWALEALCYDRARDRGVEKVVAEAGEKGAVNALVNFMLLVDAQGKLSNQAAPLYCLRLIVLNETPNAQLFRQLLPTAKPLLRKLSAWPRAQSHDVDDDTLESIRGLAATILQGMNWA